MADQIWLQKYRPKVLEEVQGNPDSLEKLRRIAKEGNIPNMILVGPPGIGKTSSVLCLARTLLQDSYSTSVQELNASDDRGIDVVRNTIQEFAGQKANLEPGQHKIIILDEADSLTQGAQQALRMIISDYADTTRFVLACNDSTKLIDAIQSRCAILRFTKLTDEEILRRLKEIIQREKIEYENSGLQAIIFTADGDMRQAINNLQATFTGFGVIQKEHVFQVCDVPNIESIKKIIQFCQKSEFNEAQAELLHLWKEGFTAYDLTNTLYQLIQNSDMEKTLQFEFLKEIAVLQMRVLEGLPTFLQLSGYLARCCDVAYQYNVTQKSTGQ